MENKFRGVIVGAAVADALGAPVEFMSAKEIKEKHGRVDKMLGGGVFNWRVGEFTDDTDQALAITDSIIEKEGYDPEDIANRFLDWYNKGPKDIGSTTAESLQRLKKGTSYLESGKWALAGQGGRGNGSLMRTHPLGLFFRGDKQKIDHAAQEVSAITHASYECLLACQIATHLVSALVSGINREEAIGKLHDENKGNRQLREILDRSLNNERFHQKSGHVLNTLSIAISSFMKSSDYKEAVIEAIHQGGDTDTQAAVTGAFAGAYWGVNAIPKEWSSVLNPVTAYELIDKADRLYALNQKT